MTANFLDGITDTAFIGLFTNRRQEEINVPVTNERRKPPNLANQAFDDLCHVCFAAGGCGCADESDESFYADRATFLSKDML